MSPTQRIGVRFLLDQGVPRDTAASLRESGYDCVHVGEIGMQRAADADILDWASERSFAVVTLDADFHTLLAVSGATGPSVIRLRIQGANSAVVARLIEVVLGRFSAELGSGSVITVKPKKMTCHRLPIGGGR